MQFGLMGMVLALAPTPAAIDPQCILEFVSPADQIAIVRAAERGDPGNSPAHERIQVAAVRCANRLGWDAAQTGTSAGLAISLIFRDGAGARLNTNGVPTAAIDRWFARQPLSFRTDPEVSDEEGQRMVLDLVGGGISQERVETNSTLIGVYLGALIVIERVERGLPLE